MTNFEKEFNTLFREAVFRKIKDKVDAFVDVTIANDTLRCVIRKGNIMAICEFDELAHQIMFGELTATEVANCMVRTFKRRVMNYYFK